MSITLSFLGAAGTVTGSRFLLERGGSRTLVDCGLFQGLKEMRNRNWEPFPVPPYSIDAVLLTHAHIDHSGYLPALVRDGFRGKIFCSHATMELRQRIESELGWSCRAPQLLERVALSRNAQQPMETGAER